MELNVKNKQEFKQWVADNSVSHAYIVEGACSVGKMSFALFCASVLLCTALDKPCGLCSSCMKIKENIHPDVRVYGKDSKPITMGEVRELISSANVKPNDGDYNIYIVGNAEIMRGDAQNALLKILEEPVASCKIFLLTENRQALLPTVTSRCRLIKLKAEAEEDILEFLQAKHKKIPLEELMAAAKNSGGWLSQGEKLLEKETKDYHAKAETLIELLQRKDSYEIYKFFYGLKYDRDKTEKFLEVLTELLNKHIISGGREFLEYAERVEDCRQSLARSGNLNAVKSYLCIEF